MVLAEVDSADGLLSGEGGDEGRAPDGVEGGGGGEGGDGGDGGEEENNKLPERGEEVRRWGGRSTSTGYGDT